MHDFLVKTPIDIPALRERVICDGYGAILVFEGTARDNFQGKKVLNLAYEAYPELAEPILQQILDQSNKRFQGTTTVMQHRIGRVPFGEPTVVIISGAPHRQECYEANRWVLEQLKSKAPIWKKEEYEDGHAWKANAATP